MHNFQIQAITFCLLGSFIGDENITDNLLADPITKNFRCISTNCCDQHEWCGFWAGIGECETNKNWMTRNCQISCRKCDDTNTIVNSTTAAPVTESVLVPSELVDRILHLQNCIALKYATDIGNIVQNAAFATLPYRTNANNMLQMFNIADVACIRKINLTTFS
ncbi:putative ShTK domain protein [Trichinella spiralis]|uniref:putative ShTK domain protein n=1 Tax=Trichinella spiralis TaxID=6334 RepID=UPI0001EFE69D|nr:putative ShTK domain protein [Trichinella spiralis]